MKQNILLVLSAIFIASFTSCADFLDKYPEEELSDGSFWKTPLDAEMFAANLYEILPGGGSGDIDGDINSDNAVHGIKWAAGNMSRGIYDPQDSGWAYDYASIRKCNLLIQKIELIPDYEQSAKEEVIAEARFFRGYIYMELIKSFGDVPYVDKPLNLSDLDNITRDPWEDIYKTVIADFDYAISKLPEVQLPARYGRVTKFAANAMKARAALYYKDWAVAAEASKMIIDSNKFQLFDQAGTGEYKKLFWEENERNSEVILARVFVKDLYPTYLLGWGTYPNIAGDAWGGINPTQSLVDSYEDNQGAPIAKSTIYDPANPFANRDSRLEVCVLHNGEVGFTAPTGPQVVMTVPLKSSGKTGVDCDADATATGYYNGKYIDQNIDIKEFRNEGRDWHVIRYAEVLLTYAEAQNEMSGLDAAALDAVNKVRSRVSMPILQATNSALPTYCASQDDLRQRIRNEWRVEYAMEGNKRHWDIKRWGIASKVLNEPFYGMTYRKYKDASALEGDDGFICVPYAQSGEGFHRIELEGSSYAEHNYLMPIPQVEIDLNDKLVQNPGY